MGPVLQQLLILMIAVWVIAVGLKRIGLPTIMGELMVGVIIGPAVLGWVQPSESIEVLASLGVFFLMLHAGVETEPAEFLDAVKVSWVVALVGAAVPFSVGMGIGRLFGLDIDAAIFVGLTMTATAVVVTLKILRDLGLQDTRMARIILSCCVLDGLLSLVMFSIVIGIVDTGGIDLFALGFIVFKVAAFFSLIVIIGHWVYPLFRHPFRDRRGKGFTFLLILGLGFGLIAEAIGLHIILGAYMAGLFFREEVANRELIQKVEDRLNGIAYTVLGPIFFISLGFHVTLDVFTGWGLWFLMALTASVAVAQVLSAGGMTRMLGFSWAESGVVGVGMCGRAEMAFVLASLGFSMGVIGEAVFSVVIATTFLLNLITPLGLKICAISLKRRGELSVAPPRKAPAPRE